MKFVLFVVAHVSEPTHVQLFLFAGPLVKKLTLIIVKNPLIGSPSQAHVVQAGFVKTHNLILHSQTFKRPTCQYKFGEMSRLLMYGAAIKMAY